MIFYLLIIILSALFTYFFIIYAKKQNIMDVPVDRSSHVLPTPRGGGVSLVISFIFVVVLSESLGSDFVDLSPLLLTSFMIGAIGFIDDHKHIDYKIRLFIHFIAAIIIVFFYGAPNIKLMGMPLNSWFGLVLIIIGIVWLTNLYNFMDGINGIACIEALSVLITLGVFSAYISEDLSYIYFSIFFIVLGFLPWNFPKARVFLGDCGSGFLGFTLSALCLVTSVIEPRFFWSFLIMLGVFIVDATTTLVWRVLNGKKIHEPHKSHSYQYFSRKMDSHSIITLTVLMINILWLAPWSYVVIFSDFSGELALLIAYLPLVLICSYSLYKQKEA
jgi:Fuc2NAc and GlcNAc transferase